MVGQRSSSRAKLDRSLASLQAYPPGELPDLAPNRPAPAAGMTYQQSIREALADRIVHGTLRPGDPLDETSLASEFGVSRTPVREALQRLEEDGLVRRTLLDPSGLLDDLRLATRRVRQRVVEHCGLFQRDKSERVVRDERQSVGVEWAGDVCRVPEDGHRGPVRSTGRPSEPATVTAQAEPLLHKDGIIRTPLGGGHPP